MLFILNLLLATIINTVIIIIVIITSDRAVIKELKSRGKSLAIAWIDYKKAYDMVPHSWIIECLDLFRVAENIKSLLVNSIEKWKVMLCSGKSELGEVDIKHGIFKEIFYPLQCLF